ncbi:MAG: carboxypeptidase regulatory-like domain-containing protein [Bacteroidales bacterium]
MEKLQRIEQAEREATKAEFDQQLKDTRGEAKEVTLSMDRAPFSNHQIQPGQVQPAFRDGHTGFAWNIYAASSGLLEGPISLNLETGASTSIQEVSTDVIWMAAGEVADDIWYTVSYDPANGSLHTVDPATGDYTLVGATGYSLTGLAYDQNSGTMYASGFDGTNSQLYTVDLNTGAATLVGQISTGIVIGIAADADGNMYGINLDDNLYTIDANTGTGTVVGPLGVTINYAQDIAFDRDNDVLYGALYTTTGGLYTIDVTTGAATLINNFVAEVAGFGIPYATAEDDAPAAVDDLTATAAAEGALEATLTWTNPSTQFNGDPLTELTEVNVYRGDVLIYTDASPAIGGAETYTDNDVALSGNYTYSVQSVNTAGESPAAGVTIYVGEDVPAAPGNVVLAAQDNDGFLTWEAPTTGLNDGYFDPASLVEYSITRNPDGATFTLAATETEFLDETVPGIGFYSYTVVAVNDVGEGGAATSNTVLLSAEGAVFMGNGEVTTCEGTFFDSGGPEGDYANNENFVLTFYPETEGAKMQFEFTAFNVEQGYDFLYVYMGEEVDEANLVGQFAGTSVPAPLVNLISTHPTGAITFRFTSDGSVPRPGWQATIGCFTPAELDLDGINISGNTTPSVGVESNYTVTLLNRGSNDLLASDYTVELRDADENVLASVDGVDVLADETVQVIVPWTPDTEGPLTILGYANLPGDGNPENNNTPSIDIVVQPADIVAVTIGDGEVLTNQPYNFVWDYSIQQTLYYPEEIGLGGGVITGIQYVNSFNETKLDKNIMIWMGETDLENLADGWVDPSTLQLVFDGQVDFPEGVNDIFIPLDEFYVYGGGNLVIYNYKMDDEWSGSKNFFNTDDPASNRTRGAQQDNTPYDPVNPTAGTARSTFPNITMFFSTEGLGALEGTVTDGTDPLEGVLVSVLGTSSTRVTDENGFYEFSALLPDTYNVEFSKFGYETVVIEGVVVEEDVATEQNAVVPLLDQFTVSGVVQGNDGVLIEEAAVTMVGYDNYSAATDASGAFTIADVFGGTYELTVIAPGYEDYMDAAVVVDADTDLGTLEVIEILYDPYGLTIETEGMEPGSALFTWNEAELLMLYQHDGEVPAEPNAFFQNSANVYGTIFDLSGYPDAVVSHIDFHHLQWGLPAADYDFLVHIVDWSTFSVIETIGPLTTSVNDDWEEEVMLGMIDVAGYDQVGILIQPQGNAPDDAYPDITADATGPSGLSIVAPFNDLSNFTVNPASVGDFFINLWISTAFTGDKIVKAEGLVSDNLEPVETRNGISVPSSEVTLTQNFREMIPSDKVFTGFNLYLNDMENPLITNHQSTSHMFTGLPGGSHTAGVQSVYTTGESEVMTIDFEVEGPEYARVQIIHNSADAVVANVDIYVNGELALPNVGFRQATPFIDIVAGVTLELHVAPAGADFEDALGPIEVMFTPGETYVVVANGIVSDTGYDPVQPFGLFVFDQGQEEAGSDDNTDVLAFHGATDAPEVSVWAMGVDNALLTFEYGEFAGYLPLPTNDYVLEIRDAAGESVIVAYEAPLATLGLEGQALTVVASGFLNPANNSDGPAFGLWVATAAGGDLLELPIYVSVQDINMSEGNITMFPNPSSDMVNLQSTNTMTEVRVVDISGRVVYTSSIESGQHQINVRQFENGIYFVQVVTADGMFTGKLQIQR